MNIKDEFLSLLNDSVQETGASLRGGNEEIALYMSERALHLSTIANEPGFAAAVLAERNNVAMRAGLAAADVSDGIRERLLGIIAGALRIAAISLL